MLKTTLEYLDDALRWHSLEMNHPADNVNLLSVLHDARRAHELLARLAACQEQVNYWIENGCIPPPTVDELKHYACSECRCRGVKLWRAPHGGEVLKCAACLSPDKPVGEDGKQVSEYGPMTDQVCDWLPAVPKLDTFYGYSSAPPQVVGWWRGLPTYPETAKDIK